MGEHKDTNHAKFLSHLRESKPGVGIVAEWLLDQGYAVTIPPVNEAKTHSGWKDCTDAGDLFINQRIEVKQLSVCFSGRADWPFRDFIVCAKHSFDRAVPRPFAYIILSEDSGSAATVLGRDWKLWTTGRRGDRRYEGVEQDFYFSPFSKVYWNRIAKG
jgi:hypothetical protein